jgi:ABC-type nickel/cobalt efflux system permease component RcnA
MRKLIAPSLLVFTLAMFTFCSGHKHEHREITAELREANEIHQKSLDVREEIMDLEKSLKEAEIDYAEIKEELKIWDKDIIEVPGFEHSHDHDHDHEHEGEHRKYHVHNPMKPFSDAEHLEYQKIMYAEIQEIAEKMKLLLVPKVMEETENNG